MGNITSKAREWPKAFYEGGGGSYGFVAPDKLQSGVLQGSLQAGVGGPIFGNGQIVIPQTSGAPIIINGGGITGISTGGGTAVPITFPAQGTINQGDAPIYQEVTIPHGLSSIPSVSGFVYNFVDDIGGVNPFTTASWRGFNQAAGFFWSGDYVGQGLNAGAFQAYNDTSVDHNTTGGPGGSEIGGPTYSVLVATDFVAGEIIVGQYTFLNTAFIGSADTVDQTIVLILSTAL